MLQEGPDRLQTFARLKPLQGGRFQTYEFRINAFVGKKIFNLLRSCIEKTHEWLDTKLLRYFGKVFLRGCDFFVCVPQGCEV